MINVNNGKTYLSTILLIFVWAFVGFAQNDSISRKYLSLGTKTYGISFGNSSKYNGLRFNLWDSELDSFDDNSKVYNGVNFTFSATSIKTNGIQLGLIVSNTNEINGISISSIYHNAKKINGFATSFGIDSEILNGVFIGFGISPVNRNIEDRVINGIAIGAFVGSEKVSGLAIGLINSYSKKQYGISISIFNKTDELHGLQLGLINYAGNNPKILRWLPLFNFHI